MIWGGKEMLQLLFYRKMKIPFFQASPKHLVAILWTAANLSLANENWERLVEDR